ncbi:MAG: NAD-dependent epimerase/dehydratase family protein [Nitrospiraceae bacterium]|nr:NAD-dependent epimerase/dehydratase family protein [Nitrospiraceae bacterium]
MKAKTKKLVTGATGFVGFHVAAKLVNKGYDVRVLVRDEKAVPELSRMGAEIVKGDIRDFSSVSKAAKGCEEIYHLAADYRLWVPDPAGMYETNVTGTVNVMKAALEAGAGKVVYTSSVGALAPSRKNGPPSNENTPVSLSDMIGPYKRSKFLAGREVEKFAAKGLPVVIVNPSTPIGAMDRKPTPTGAMIVSFLNGKVPAYLDTGLNFVNVEDVAEGHLLAARYGRPGEKYILGGHNMTLKDFYSELAMASGIKAPSFKVPYTPVLIAAYISEGVSRFLTRKPPAIPLTGVKMAGKYMYYDSTKAQNELKMPKTPIKKAVMQAIEWFTGNGYVSARKIGVPICKKA